MPNIQPNNDDIIAKSRQRLDAIDKHFADAKTTLYIDGKPCTVAELRAVYQESLDIRAAIHSQRGVLNALLAKRARIEAQRLAADRALKPWVVNRFGQKSVAALEFGFPPPKVGVMTTEQKVKAVELRLATRKARKTMGKRQREKIKGELPKEA
jgi:hypothetical protein